MKIAVLDFASVSVDVISVDDDFIEINYHGDIELFLSWWCGYDLDNIQWMSNKRIGVRQDLAIDDFDGDEDIKLNNLENDETYYFL